jgi:CBS domain-containing protein
MKNMKKHTFTHVPVMQDGAMAGVFSENSILAYLADTGDVILPKDTKVEEFKRYIGLEAHPSESFAFLPRAANLGDVYQVFNDAIKVRKRIGVLFITEHGNPQQKVLGIITAWDLATPDLTR